MARIRSYVLNSLRHGIVYCGDAIRICWRHIAFTSYTLDKVFRPKGFRSPA